MEQNKDLGGAAVRGEAVVDIAEVDKHLEAVLRAGGSSMRYFSMPKAVSDMRDAIIEAMRSNAVQVSARAADAPSEPSVRRHDAYKLASRLQSFADRLCNDQTIGTRYEGDEAELRTAIHFIRSSGRAADALDSQPTEPDGLPPLPEPIEVGGEGWDFDDFKSEKTFSCEHMWAYARAAIASSQPTDGDGCDECRHTYCLNGEVCRHCGDVNGTQGWKGGRQPTDGGVQS